MNLKGLVGSGDKIGLFTLVFVAIGLILNYLFPALFSIGEMPLAFTVLFTLTLIVGVVFWLWSVYLILTRVPKEKLITVGPYSLVKHPLYASVALLVLPSAGFLLGSWLGILFGAALYAGSRLFSPQEEKQLAAHFGASWTNYSKKVKIPWL